MILLILKTPIYPSRYQLMRVGAKGNIKGVFKRYFYVEEFLRRELQGENITLSLDAVLELEKLDLSEEEFRKIFFLSPPLEIVIFYEWLKVFKDPKDIFELVKPAVTYSWN